MHLGFYMINQHKVLNNGEVVGQCMVLMVDIYSDQFRFMSVWVDAFVFVLLFGGIREKGG